MQCNSQIAEYNADDLVLFSFNQIPDNFSCQGYMRSFVTTKTIDKKDGRVSKKG